MHKSIKFGSDMPVQFRVFGWPVLLGVFCALTMMQSDYSIADEARKRDSRSKPGYVEGNLGFFPDVFSTNKRPFITVQNAKSNSDNDEVLSWGLWKGAPDPDFMGKSYSNINQEAQQLFDRAYTQMLFGDLTSAEKDFQTVIRRYSGTFIARKARQALAQVYDKKDAKNSETTNISAIDVYGSGIHQLSILSLKDETTDEPDKSGGNIRRGNVVASASAAFSKEDFRLNVGDRIFFRKKSASLTPDALKVLNAQVLWLKKKSHKVVIEGHSDDGGSNNYNMTLSAVRASKVQQYLLNEGIDPGRITTKHFGKNKPVALCNKEDCSVQNRRVVIKLIPSTSN